MTSNRKPCSQRLETTFLKPLAFTKKICFTVSPPYRGRQFCRHFCRPVKICHHDNFMQILKNYQSWSIWITPITGSTVILPLLSTFFLSAKKCGFYYMATMTTVSVDVWKVFSFFEIVLRPQFVNCFRL